MDLALARAALVDALTRFIDVVSSVDPTLRLPNSDWTVADTAAHVVVAGHAFERYARGDREPVIDVDDVAGSNARLLSELAERDVTVLTKELGEATGRFLELTDHAVAADAAYWHGLDTTVGTLYGIYLGELLLHGRDVARAVGERWPISRDEAITILEGGSAVVHALLDTEKVEGLRATYEVRLRGGPRLGFAFADGALTVTPGRVDRADCRVSADPLAMVLVFYGRASQWSQIARGKLIAFGRKPWLAFRFTSLFKSF
jgi:uncharacterized protein (TIGR03083 family)